MTKTRTGLVGYPLGHSLSPRIHDYWIRQYGLDASYELFPVVPEQLSAKVAQLLVEGVAGFNVTIPHKERILDSIKIRDMLVEQIGATNTVILDASKNQFTCTNTDAYGFIANLTEEVKDRAGLLSHIFILGAGGATRASIVALHNAGANNIVLCNRTDEKAARLAAEFGVKSTRWATRHEALGGVSLLVNTTSLGMQGNPPLDLSLERLPPNAVVHDIVYAPLVTPLLAAARARGNQTVDGLGMLLYQARAAFALWHGITPEVTAGLRAHILAA